MTIHNKDTVSPSRNITNSIKQIQVNLVSKLFNSFHSPSIRKPNKKVNLYRHALRDLVTFVQF